MRLTLRTKILLLVAGTVTGLAAVILLAIGLLAGREMDRAVRNDVRAAGGMLAQFMRERRAALMDQCVVLAKQPSLLALISADPASGRVPDSATAVDSMREWLSRIRADEALVTDGAGRTLGETSAPGERGTDRSGDAGIASALDGRPWSGVVVRDGHIELAVSVPVTDPVSRYVRGTCSAYQRIDSQMARSLKDALGSDVAFVRGGKVMAASLPLSGLPSSLSGNVPSDVELDGERYYALYAPLPDSDPKDGIGFASLHDHSRALTPYRRFQMGLLAFSVLVLALALVAGAWVGRSLARPLDGVVHAALLLREGAWPEPFEIRTHDEIGLLQAVFNEMTVSMRASQERLLALLDTDPLTELDNHRRFHERLEQEARRCRDSGEPLSMLLIDLDHFHQFNQQYGHAAGDEALQQTAQVLQAGLPGVAIPARFGGEEFAVLLPRHTVEEAEEVAEQIREMARTFWDTTGRGPALTLSIGCAEFGTHTKQAEGLVVAAELAVSQAKQLGRDRVCRFDSVPGADETADPYQLHRFLKDGSIATIQALAAAVDAKDPYTQGHSQRVAEYASSLAKRMGLSEDEIDLIFTTGTLHDVGKIGVPDAVLKKPGRLDDEERAIMETHPALGEVIVKKAPQLAATLPGVRSHHERWDGKGYPDRLSGDDIPLIARILALADTFDAMTSDRPYRKGLTFETALEEVEKCSGKQFDPSLAPAFVEMMRSRGAASRAA